MDFHREKGNPIAGRWIALLLALMFILPSSSMMGSAVSGGSGDRLVVTANASPSEAEPGQTIHFRSNAKFGDPVEGMTDVTSSTSFVWDLGDGSNVLKGSTVSHSYSSKGTYTVTVTGTYGSYTDTDQLTVKIGYFPVAVISASTTEPRAYLDEVHFDASESYDSDGSITSYKWDFGDGSTATGKTADHVFKEGKYTVRLTVTDNDGFTDTATITIDSRLPDYRITNTIDNSTHPKVYSYQNDLRVFWIENASSVMESTSNDYGWTWSNASEIFSSPSQSITNIRMAYDENNLVLAVECAPSGEFPFLYILYSDDAGNTWFSPYSLRGDRPSIDIVGSDIYLVYRRWSGLGTPDFYLTMVITYMSDGTVYSHGLGNPSGASEFTGVPRIAVVENGSERDIYVTVADYVTKNVYFWKSMDNGDTWSSPAVIARLTEVSEDYMALTASPHGIYFVYSDNRMQNYELWLRYYSQNAGSGEWEWSEPILLTNALGDSFQPVVRRDGDGYVHIAWSDFRNCRYEIYEMVLDGRGNTVKNDWKIANSTGKAVHPNMFIDSDNRVAVTDEYYRFEVWQEWNGSNYEIYFKNNLVDAYVGQTAASVKATVQTAQDYIRSLPDDYFSNPLTRRPLINKYEVVGKLIENGFYQAAATKIKYDITPKMDGFEGGNPKNDWIIADTAQDYLGGVNGIMVYQPSPPGPEPPITPLPPAPSPPPPSGGGGSGSSGGTASNPEIYAVNVVSYETKLSITWSVDWPDIQDHPSYSSSISLYYNGQEVETQTVNYTSQPIGDAATFTGLSPNTRYDFTITATEVSGGIEYSDTYKGNAKTAAHVLTITSGPYEKISTIGEAEDMTNVSSTAQIEWWTNHLSTSVTKYHEVGSDGWITITKNKMVSHHIVKLTGLKPDTSYEYTVTSENPDYDETPTASGSFSTPAPISNITVNISSTTATITWQTGEAGDSEVYYGLSNASENSISTYSFGTEHTVTIQHLWPSTTYKYYVKTVRPQNSPDIILQSFVLTFTTKALFTNIEARDYYSIDEDGRVIEGELITWTTSEKTTNNHVKYIDENDITTDESLWDDRRGEVNATRSHYEVILTNITKDVKYAYKVYSTVESTEDIRNSTLQYFKALPDTDGDGLHDAEEDYGWVVKTDINGDGDTDDLYENYRTTSKRMKNDTDGDGLDDAQEKALGTSPQYYDTDYDYLTDKYEVTKLGTDPLEADTDGDGLLDGEEVLNQTDPLNTDTDGDGMGDGWEVRYNLNPLVNDAANDSDGDGLTNLEEYNHRTNPLKSDTDGDGLSDGEEVHTYGTKPLKPDTDYDGLKDGEEVNTYGTNPLKSDTDGDGMSDLYEVRCGVDVGGWQDPKVYNERYAVLIARRTAADANYDEFWNDLKIMYDILKNNYGYIDDNKPGFDPSTDHIAVLYDAGNDVKTGKYGTPTGTTITDFSATKANLQTVFNTLSNVMGDNDFLFIWTFDHGSYVDSNGNDKADLGEHVTLGVQDGEIQDDTFATDYVGLIQHYNRRVFVMQQCFSGGFIDDLSNTNTVIVTAARGDETAHRVDTENEVVNGITYHHGEFLYYFESALNWVTPQGTAVNADDDGNGYVSILEAFNYVTSHENRPETPQLDDDGNGLSQQNNDIDDGDFAGSTFL